MLECEDLKLGVQCHWNNLKMRKHEEKGKCQNYAAEVSSARAGPAEASIDNFIELS